MSARGRVALAVGLLGAAAASQVPEYERQYVQRLGGAIDELARQAKAFDGDAIKLGMTRDAALAHLRADSDPVARARAAAFIADEARRRALVTQRDALTREGPFTQVATLMGGLDGAVARGTLGDFRPAAPLTAEGLVAAALGFLFGGGLCHALAWPFRRRDGGAKKPGRKRTV
ncbi:MAG: DUF2937 family protein [Hyphomicrobiales bacterium]|nr:DUF2937 family protein [Hyphomicrobiales bacterium]MDE2017103.1 DUF2937 family protein [Hyphomicrobiales bacterium]